MPSDTTATAPFGTTELIGTALSPQFACLTARDGSLIVLSTSSIVSVVADTVRGNGSEVHLHSDRYDVREPVAHIADLLNARGVSL